MIWKKEVSLQMLSKMMTNRGVQIESILPSKVVVRGDVERWGGSHKINARVSPKPSTDASIQLIK